MKYLLDTDTIIYWLNGNKNISAKVVTDGFNAIALLKKMPKVEKRFSGGEIVHPLWSSKGGE